MQTENAGGFFDVGLSDIFGAYLKAETDKSRYSFDAYQQGLAQASAIQDAEKQTQIAHIADVTDPDTAQKPLETTDKKMFYVFGGLAVLVVLVFVLNK